MKYAERAARGPGHTLDSDQRLASDPGAGRGPTASPEIHELESAGIIKDYGRIWDINPPKLADGTYPLLHDKGHIGGLFKGLFGYNGDPSIIELIFWLSMVTGLSYTWRKFATK